MSSSLARLRIVAINDIYELTNLPKFQTFLSQLKTKPDCVVLAGDFLSPSTLSSIDGGRGMVSTLRAVGLTHACFGNHEADLQLPHLESRIMDLTKSDRIKFINTNLRTPSPKAPEWLTGPKMPPYSIVNTKCERVRVALFGLISDEKVVFRDGTFRGVPISNVLDSFESTYKDVVDSNPSLADFVVPMTHMSIDRDKQLAEHMLKMRAKAGVIIGGHEHEPFDVLVESSDSDDTIRILKSGTEAEGASLVDFTFEVFDTGEAPKLAEVEADIVSMKPYKPSVVVQKIVDSKMSVVKSLQNEIIVNADTLLPPGTPLSSERPRYQQTTIGGVFCKAIKDELEVDVAIINGATIKGDRLYDNDKISYAELKKELPFPTKMVVVPMLRWELQEAIHYSRTHTEKGVAVEENEDTPRRGYLQVDLEYDHVGVNDGPLDEVLKVALPRNLLNGFCRIKPLMEIGQRLKDEGRFPGKDDFVPAIDVIVRYFCKNIWFDIVKESIRFEDIDLDGDKVLDREEIKVFLEKFLGHEPPDFVVDDMINAIDSDENGLIGKFFFIFAIVCLFIFYQLLGNILPPYFDPLKYCPMNILSTIFLS